MIHDSSFRDSKEMIIAKIILLIQPYCDATSSGPMKMSKQNNKTEKKLFFGERFTWIFDINVTLWSMLGTITRTNITKKR